MPAPPPPGTSPTDYTHDHLEDAVTRALSRWHHAPGNPWTDDYRQEALVAAYAARDAGLPFAAIIVRARSAAVDFDRWLRGRDPNRRTGRDHARRAGWAALRLDAPLGPDTTLTYGDTMEADPEQSPEHLVLGPEYPEHYDRELETIAVWPERWTRIASDIAAGRLKQDIAADLGISPGRLSQELRDMRASLRPEEWSTHYESRGGNRRGDGLATVDGDYFRKR